MILDLLPRPLDPVRSLKIRLGLVLIVAGAAGMAWFTIWLRWFPLFTSVTAIIVASCWTTATGVCGARACPDRRLRCGRSSDGSRRRPS